MAQNIQELYDMILEQVQELGEVRDTDKAVIEQLAFNIYTVKNCQKQLLEEGFTQTGLHGVKEHPCVNIKNKAEQAVRNQLIVLGLDFASQLKKKVAGEDKNAWSDFL